MRRPTCLTGSFAKSSRSPIEGHERSVESRLALRTAEALREEFGVGIDAHPGDNGNEAGTVNRSFRAAGRVVMGAVVSPRSDLAAVLAWALRRTAPRRLVEHGAAEGLLDLAPRLGDRWLAYLALAPATIIDDLLAGPTGE